MSNGINNLVASIQQAIEERDNRKKSPYDTEAKVIRVVDDIAWVKIPGGVDETPAQIMTNAKAGDNVMVRISGGRAWILGNSTSPPTDDTTANTAIYISKGASKVADIANETASEAIRDAETAHEAAVDAQKSAAEAYEAAEEAKDSAESAQKSADAAYTAAGEAIDFAHEANYAANGALTQLSVVEDVVGTLNWISDHGTYTKTEDKELDPNKTYFVKINGVYTPVAQPDQEQIKRYYELSLDDSLQNYISTHLALTDEGLYVVKDDMGYKILLANDGMKVYDAEGHLVSTFGEYIRFSSEKPQYIGSDDAYIIFDPKTGQINIGGNVVLGGDMTLDKLLAEVNALEVEYTISEDSAYAYFQAHIFRGSEDVTTQFDERCFTWYYKTENGEEPINGNNGTNTGYTMTVDINNLFDYEGHVITHFTHSYVDYYIEDGHAFVKADSVTPEDIGEYGFTIDEFGDLIYTYDDKTVADFALQDGRLKALTQYGIFGNKLTRETAIYKKGALAKALAEKADNQDFFQATQDIYIQATSALANIPKKEDTWVDYEGESVVSADPTVKPPDAETGLTPRWTLKRPTYQHNYPVIFIAKQTLTKKVDGTLEISCTKPLMDDSQTIIDGGHITTGTIDASRVRVVNLDASNITAGTIDASKVDVTNINAHNIRAGTLDYLNISEDGMDIIKDGVSIAYYGDESRVGESDGYYTKMTESSIELHKSDDALWSVMASGEKISAVNTQSLLKASKPTSGLTRSTSVILNPNVAYVFQLYASPVVTASYSFTTSSASTTALTITSNDNKQSVTVSFIRQYKTVNGTSQIAHVKATVTQRRSATSDIYYSVGLRYTGQMEDASVHFFGNNNILWSGGAAFMHATQTIDLEESVSSQPSGIVLAWSYWNGSAAEDSDWHFTFIPKWHVLAQGGASINCGIWTYGSHFNYVASKLVYVSNTQITGYANNSQSGTGSSGIKYDNSKWVLRYVLGV